MTTNFFMDYYDWLAKAKMPKGKKASLKAAAELFAKQGYHGTSTQQIAEKAGVSQATIFKYFPTKEILFSELLSPIIDNIKSDFWVELPRHTDLREAVHFIVRDRYALSKANHALVRIILQEIMVNAELKHLIIQKISGIKAEGQAYIQTLREHNPELSKTLDSLTLLRNLISPLAAYFVQIYILNLPNADEEKALARIEEEIIFNLTH